MDVSSLPCYDTYNGVEQPPAIAAAAAHTAGAPAPQLQIVQESRTVSDDDTEATAATVRMMCEYIDEGARDTLCQTWAAEAVRLFGGEQYSNAVSCTFADYWMLKHGVKFRRDEPELFRIGQKSARDLLTSPAALIRQETPGEDCDGFTMLMCCLLKIQGIPYYIVTIKADPRDPSRYSHVFALADLDQLGAIALDASHGKYPGWMVPKQHTFAYRVWDAKGNPVPNVELPYEKSRLQGYARKGMGDYGDMDSTLPLPAPEMGTPNTGGGFNWGSLANILGQTAANINQAFNTPTPAQLYGYAPGTVPATISATASSNALPWILGGGALLMVMMMSMKGGKH